MTPYLPRYVSLALLPFVFCVVSAHADPPPEFLLSWGSQGYADNQFQYPIDLSIDPAGDVYVLDQLGDSACVKVFSSDGTFLRRWGATGSGDGQLFQPTGIGIDPFGTVYIADNGNHRIHKFDASGELLETWTLPPLFPTTLQPYDVCADASGTVWVSDVVDGGAIQMFTTDGGYLRTSGPGWGSVRGILVDAIGRVAFVNAEENVAGAVRICSSDISSCSIWGPYGSQFGSFKTPAGLAEDGQGLFYIADGGNHRIQVFTSVGILRTAWGTFGSGNGEFQSPQGIAVDNGGFIYVADSGNRRIQKCGAFTSVTKSTWGSIKALFR